MSVKEIQNLLSTICPVSENTASQLFSMTKVEQHKKGDLIEKSGQKIKYQIIVRKGILRVFLTDTKGNQHTISFFSDNEAVTPAIIRSLDSISYVNIDVVSKKAEIVLFSNQEMEQSMQGNKDLELFGYKVLMKDAYHRAEREKILLTATGLEKLNWFRVNYPNLENKIPHYFIASFLGMTPTSLSRLRKLI